MCLLAMHVLDVGRRKQLSMPSDDAMQFCRDDVEKVLMSSNEVMVPTGWCQGEQLVAGQGQMDHTCS